VVEPGVDPGTFAFQIERGVSAVSIRVDPSALAQVRVHETTRAGTGWHAPDAGFSRDAPRFEAVTPTGPCMLICMHSTSVRINAGTHDELKRLAAELNTTVGNTVTLAVRALRQDRIGQDLTAALRDDEAAWLDADFG
jgi:hypothetical protein